MVTSTGHLIGRRKKNMWEFSGTYVEKYVDYAENKVDYA